MKVSVVVCTYSLDMYDHFVEAAESVFDQTHDDVELVVVVDGSEALAERVRSDFGDKPDVIFHANERNQGLLDSRNTGAELATGEVVAFMDDDAVADERWLEELVADYEEHGVLAAGGKMTPEWMAGKPAILPEEFYFLVGVTHAGFADGSGEVRNTFGSNISFRRDVFLELGGFDAEIGGRKGGANLQGGETELCARMRDRYGEGVMYNPAARVAHKVFDYRIRPLWLLNRAFWQGYSKRAMESIVPGSGDEEGRFLRRLLFDFVPRRVRDLCRSPSIAGVTQLVMLFLFTGTVGAGYLYGAVRW